jgi:hypothetical protein
MPIPRPGREDVASLIMQARDYLLFPANEVPYTTLDPTVLLELATQQEEPFIATSALGELAVRGEEGAKTAARAILRKPWDHQLTASALSILFDREPRETIAAMRRLLADDPVLLEAMLEAVLTDPACFADHHDFVADLAARVAALPDKAFFDPAQRARFAAHRSATHDDLEPLKRRP